MIENIDTVPIFISDKGVPYRLFIHNCPEKEKIAELIECGFGTVESCPVGENTIVLAAPGFPAGKNEIFSTEYIIACCSRSKKLNIKDFRLNKISEYNENFNAMDVLEGILTWSEAEKYRSESLLAGQSSFLANDNSGDSGNGAHTETSLHLRRQREYSLAHEKDIVECVARHGAYDLVKGTALWKMMEEKKMCGGRTWQSMKEHFLKKILPSIESFNLTETQLTRFKNPNCNNSRRPRQKQNLKSSVFQESNGMLNRRIGSSSTNSDEQSSLYTEQPDGQDDQCVLRNTNYYTEAEDIALLKFVAEHKRYKATGGVRLWKLMERKKAVPGRSWQSMKERYRKVLIQKLDKYLPSDVATQMLEADLEGTRQRTKKRKAPAAPRVVSSQTHTQMTEPDAAIRKIYSDYLTKNFTGHNGSTNTSKNSVDSNVLVVTSTPNKNKSIQNHIHSPKRKLFSQKRSLVEFTPASESGKSTQSSENQSAPMVKVHHRELNSESDDRGCSSSVRYAAVARVHKKSQHVKDITTRDTGKSVVAVHNTGHTCQENTAWKLGGLFRKQGISKESSVLEKEGNLLEFRGASEKSTLDNTSSECNLDIVSGEGTDGEINMHLCHSNSAQQMSEEEEVRRNDVRNVPTEELVVLSKESKTEVMSYKREKQGEIINDHILENIPDKGSAVQSKSSRHVLQGHSVVEKLSCGRSQDEVMSEKTSYEQNVQDLSDKESLLQDDNFTQTVAICMKTWNTGENIDSLCLSQNSCVEGTVVSSCSHDDSLNEEDISLGGTELNTLKRKHIIPDNQNNTGKSSENAGNEREETHEECQENNTNLTCMQPLREANDHREVQGIERNHDKVNTDDNRGNGSDIPLHDVYKLYKQNAGQLSFHEYVKETLNASAHILPDHRFEVLGCPEVICSRSNGNEQESDNGRTEHTSEENAIMRLSSPNSRTAHNTCVDTLLTQEEPTVNNSEGPEHTVEKIICSTSQHGHVTCSGLSDKERLGCSSLKSGHTDDISGGAHVSCSTSSVSSCIESNSDIVLENITANADKPSPEQPTYCCSSQASMSPSSLPPEESSHSDEKGFAAHQAATTSKCADIRDLGQPVSSEHKNTNSSDQCESSTEDSDTEAQKSVGSQGHDLCESCCSLAASTASTDNSTAMSSHSNASKKLNKLLRGSKDCPVCAGSQNMKPSRQNT